MYKINLKGKKTKPMAVVFCFSTAEVIVPLCSSVLWTHPSVWFCTDPVGNLQAACMFFCCRWKFTDCSTNIRPSVFKWLWPHFIKILEKCLWSVLYPLILQNEQSCCRSKNQELKHWVCFIYLACQAPHL